MDTHRGSVCRCTPNQRRRYLGRVSGPLLDRIDVRIVLERPSLAAMSDKTVPESSDVIAQRVAHAHELLIKSAIVLELADPNLGLRLVSSRQLLERWALVPAHRHQLELACGPDSLRGRDRTVRLAWTIAALNDRDRPNAADIEAAVELRGSDQQWAA